MLLLIVLPLGLWRVLQSQRVILAVADWAMEQFTDLRLELRNPKIDLLGGVLSADEIHLIPEGVDGPGLVTVLGFSGRTTLRDLLLADLAHSSLTAEQVLIYVSRNDEAEDPAPVEWLQYLTWLPQEHRVDTLHVVASAARTLILSLAEIRGERLGAQRYRVTGKAYLEGETLQIEAELHAFKHERLFTGLELDGQVVAPDSGTDVTFEGNLRGTREKFEYNFATEGRYGDVSAFLKGFRTVGALEGSLQVKGQVQGDNESITLSDASIILDNMPRYGFEAGGELKYSFDGNSELNVVAAGEMSSLDLLIDWVGLDLTGLGEAQANIVLTGSLDRPFIDQFILSTRKQNGLSVNVSGSGYVPGMVPQDDRTSRNEIQVDVLAPSVAVLEPWIGSIGIEPGDWRASGKLIGNRDNLAIEDLILETGSDDTVIVRAEGSVGNILDVRGRGPAGITGIKADITAHVSDTAHLARLLNKEIPPGHQVNARASLAGDGDRLLVSEGRVDVTAPGVAAGIDIESALLRLQEDDKLTGLQGRVTLNLDDSAAAQHYVDDLELPPLGPISAGADLLQDGARLSLRNLHASTATGALQIEARGGIEDLVNLGGVNLLIDFEGVRIEEVLAYLLDDFDYARPLGHLQGRFRLKGARDAWQIDDILLDTSETGGAIDLQMRGSIRAVAQIPEANFSAKSEIRDPDLLEALLGLRLKPVSLEARASSRPGRLVFSTRSKIGDTRFSMGSVIEHDQSAISSLEIALATPHVYLADLGLQAGEQEGPADYNPAQQLDTDTEGLLEKVLRSPPPFPLALKLQVDGITGVNTHLEGVDLHLVGQDQRYTLRDFTLRYADTQAELRGAIDLNSRPPASTIGIEAVAVPANALSRDLGMKTDVSGTLTVRGGLTAFGDTLEAMTPTLEGRLAVALKDAVIQGGAYDVLATDLLRWIYSAAALKTSTELDCTMGLLEFKGGVIRTDSLYIETPEMVATGEGKLDMVKKRIDLTVTPLSKSRTIQVPSSVRIKGPLDSPTPIISPVTAVMDVSAEALTLIPRLTFRLFGIKPSPQRQSQPCEP